MAIIYNPSKSKEEMAREAGVSLSVLNNFLQRNGYQYKKDNDEYWRKRVIAFDESHHNITKAEMAKTLGISKARLSRYLDLASDPAPNSKNIRKHRPIFSVNSTDNAILRDILTLYLPNHKTFDCDLTFGEGGFYCKGIQVPQNIFDKNFEECPKQYKVRSLDEIYHLGDSVFNSIVIDLPVSIEEIRETKNEGKNKTYREKYLRTDLNAFKSLNEMFTTYDKLIKESARLLKEKGILIFKTSDFVLRNDKHATYAQEWATDKAVEFALEYGFELIDKFILLLKNEVLSTGSKRMKSALKHAVYLVFQKVGYGKDN